ncbi:MAG: hypothetical protein ABII18_07735 [bacterium]
MKKYLFNIDSPIFKAMLAIIVGLSFYNLYNLIYIPSLTTIITFALMTFLAVLILICGVYPWYGLKYKGRGIETHFEVLLFITLYTFLIPNVLHVFKIYWPVLNIVLIIFYFGFLITNVLLLQLHFQDKDKTPPSHYAHNES